MWLLSTVAITVMSCLCLTSCGDDDDSDSVSSLLIGTWRWDTEDGYCWFEFKNDGTYSYHEVLITSNGKEDEYDDEYGTYSVRAEKYIDCTYYVSGIAEYETWTIQMITKDRLILTMTGDDDVWDMYRVK